MKPLKIHSFLLIICFALFISSCSTTSTSVQVLVPADITVPHNIRKLVIANRSLPDKGEQFSNFIEGFLTGESILADREGSKRCVEGLGNKLNSSPRFDAVISHTSLKGTGTREFSVPLQWNMVNNICKQYNADALVLLETFDSNIAFKTDKKQKKQTIKDKETGISRDTIITEYLADLIINVNAGWRIYDPVNKKIIDEDSFTDEKRWAEKGKNPEDVERKLPSKRDAINGAGYFAGQQFAMRISPNWKNATRYYYIKGRNNYFKMAKQYAKAGNWDKAMEFWGNLTSNPNRKIAGRASHNMAVANEMKGNLKQALKWADTAYKKYNIKKDRTYINILTRRIMDQDKLKEQM